MSRSAETNEPELEAPTVPSTFDALPLGEPVRKAIEAIGWTHPTPVQLETYELAAAGRDLIVQARTGTGKTAAFGIPIVDRLVRPEPHVQALLLAPTRELALQSQRELQRLAAHSGLETVAIYGGAPMEKQVQALRRGAQIVSGTPGRVLDHLRRGTLDVSRLRVLVLDEADEMLSMGFLQEVSAIIERLPESRQTMLFSATVDEAVRRLADRYLSDPVLVSLSGDAVGARSISHFAYLVPGTGKQRDLLKILEVEDPESAIVFCNTKVETERLASFLQEQGYTARFLSGDLPQSERERVLAATRQGALRYLVATDVAARGIDISHLTHVVNYDFPESAEQYVHRTGRTGRAGRTGTAISLITPKDLGALYYLRLQYGIAPVERRLPSRVEEASRREMDRIALLEEAFPEPTSTIDRAVARRLLTHPEAERILAGLLAAFFGRAGEDIDEQAAAKRRSRRPRPVESTAEPERAERPRRKTRHAGEEEPGEGPSDPSAGTHVLMYMNVGRKDGLKRREEVRKLLHEEADLHPERLGRIRIKETHVHFEVPSELADVLCERLSGKEAFGRSLTVERARSSR